MIRTESRKHGRIKCRVIVEGVGPTIDIAAGGLSVLVANAAPEGAELPLVFHLPESERPVKCHGRVVHVSPSNIDPDLRQMGVQFMRMMARDHKAIADYVISRSDRTAWSQTG